MSGSKNIDILMKFQISGNSYLEAESTDSLGLDAFYSGGQADPLLQGFQKGKVFEVFDFSFGAGNKSNSESDEVQELKNDRRAAKDKGDKEAIQRFDRKIQKRQNSEIKTWQFGELNNDVEMQPVTFSRSVDKGSSTLLKRCFDSVYFDSVTLVKRRSVGRNLSGYAYLRMDFGEVMIGNIAWTDDDEVKETITLHFRKILIQYCPILPSGEVGYPISGNWEMPGLQPLTMA